MKHCMSVNPVFKKQGKVIDTWKSVAKFLSNDKRHESKVILNSIQVKNRVNILLKNHNNNVYTHKPTKENREMVNMLEEHLMQYMAMLHKKERKKNPRTIHTPRVFNTEGEDDEIIDSDRPVVPSKEPEKFDFSCLLEVRKLEIQAQQETQKMQMDHFMSLQQGIFKSMETQTKTMESQSAALMQCMHLLNGWDQRFTSLILEEVKQPAIPTPPTIPAPLPTIHQQNPNTNTVVTNTVVPKNAPTNVAWNAPLNDEEDNEEDDEEEEFEEEQMMVEEEEEDDDEEEVYVEMAKKPSVNNLDDLQLCGGEDIAGGKNNKEED